jgi:hypothetical protein
MGNHTLACLDSLGVDMHLEDGDFITDAVVVARISKADGTMVVGMDTSTGTDVIVERGLIEFALEAHRRETWSGDDH